MIHHNSLKDEDKTTFLNPKGILRINGHDCIARVGGCLRLILEDAYCSRYTIHLEADKMYHILKKHYWWGGMKKDIVKFVAKYLNYQQVKYEHQQLGGMMQRIFILKWKLEQITMNFTIGLPQL